MLKILKILEILKFWNSTLLVLARRLDGPLKIFRISIFQNFDFEKNKKKTPFFIDFLISHKNDADTVQPT